MVSGGVAVVRYEASEVWMRNEESESSLGRRAKEVWMTMDEEC